MCVCPMLFAHEARTHPDIFVCVENVKCCSMDKGFCSLSAGIEVLLEACADNSDWISRVGMWDCGRSRRGWGIFVPMLTLIVGFDTKSAAALSKCMIMGASASSVCVVFPYWLITVLIIILFLGTSSRPCFKGAEMRKEETILKKEYAREQEAIVSSQSKRADLINEEYESLLPREEKSMMQILMFNLRWKKVLVLVAVWIIFLLQILKASNPPLPDWRRT
ncbi:hypothetical protein C1H46_017108 [Malus baccata]|uniref:Uncharacterized protein n=1 Tax=Malus baccata TaxID=106549 RepID=A0A540MEU4_MALBA|nr:hypothetical protein C1H46_017108 [Malus baccata]